MQMLKTNRGQRPYILPPIHTTMLVMYAFLFICRVHVMNINEYCILLLLQMNKQSNKQVVRVLLDYGAHLDQPNRSSERPLNLITNNASNQIPLMKYLSLKCMAASSIIKHKVMYRQQIPSALEAFVELHRA